MDRPKRHYTVTDRVLAASRRNLVRANAVDKAIRYRMTPRRRIACHRNLVCAQTARRTSPRYGPIRHGAYCLSLERSLELAGESPAEFSAHLEDWRGAIAPEGPIHRGEGEEQGKLARGLGQASWRRLRVLRGQARWEARRLGRCLAEAIHRAETVTPEECADHAQALMLDVLEVFGATTDIDPALEQLNRRLERLLEAWLESRTGERVSLKHFTERAGRGLGIGERPEEALGNALVGPGRVRKSLAAGPPVRVLAPAFWRERSWEAVERNLAELRAADPSLDPDVAYQFALKEFAPRERASRRPEKAMGYTASLDNLTRAFEAALLGPDSSGLGPPGTDGDSPRWIGASPELRALIREVAELVWQRLEYFRASARAEAEKVKEALKRGRRESGVEREEDESGESGVGSRESRASGACCRREGKKAQHLAEQLLEAFAPDLTRWRETFRLEQNLKASLQRLLKMMPGVRGQLPVAS